MAVSLDGPAGLQRAQRLPDQQQLGATDNAHEDFRQNGAALAADQDASCIEAVSREAVSQTPTAEGGQLDIVGNAPATPAPHLIAGFGRSMDGEGSPTETQSSDVFATPMAGPATPGGSWMTHASSLASSSLTAYATPMGALEPPTPSSATPISATPPADAPGRTHMAQQSKKGLGNGDADNSIDMSAELARANGVQDLVSSQHQTSAGKGSRAADAVPSPLRTPTSRSTSGSMSLMIQPVSDAQNDSQGSSVGSASNAPDPSCRDSQTALLWCHETIDDDIPQPAHVPVRTALLGAPSVYPFISSPTPRSPLSRQSGPAASDGDAIRTADQALSPASHREETTAPMQDSPAGVTQPEGGTVSACHEDEVASDNARPSEVVVAPAENVALNNAATKPLGDSNHSADSHFAGSPCEPADMAQAASSCQQLLQEASSGSAPAMETLTEGSETERPFDPAQPESSSRASSPSFTAQSGSGHISADAAGDVSNETEQHQAACDDSAADDLAAPGSDTKNASQTSASSLRPADDDAAQRQSPAMSALATATHVITPKDRIDPIDQPLQLGQENKAPEQASPQEAPTPSSPQTRDMTPTDVGEGGLEPLQSMQENEPVANAALQASSHGQLGMVRGLPALELPTSGVLQAITNTHSPSPGAGGAASPWDQSPAADHSGAPTGSWWSSSSASNSLRGVLPTHPPPPPPPPPGFPFVRPESK